MNLTLWGLIGITGIIIGIYILVSGEGMRPIAGNLSTGWQSILEGVIWILLGAGLIWTTRRRKK